MNHRARAELFTRRCDFDKLEIRKVQESEPTNRCVWLFFSPFQDQILRQIMIYTHIQTTSARLVFQNNLIWMFLALHGKPEYSTRTITAGIKPMIVLVWGSDSYTFFKHPYFRFCFWTINTFTAVASTQNCHSHRIKKIKLQIQFWKNDWKFACLVVFPPSTPHDNQSSDLY